MTDVSHEMDDAIFAQYDTPDSRAASRQYDYGYGRLLAAIRGSRSTEDIGVKSLRLH